ncbi:MAG TPA: M28 family peptidase, partial [Gemmatimonadaceae bacterium]
MTSSLARITLALAVPLALLGQRAAAQEAAGSSGVVPLPPTTLPLKHAPQATTAAITAADLMTRLYIFSDDSMQGREAGAEGNVKGTDYIAGEIKRMGLKPAGDNGTYFQTIPLETRGLDEASSITAGGAKLVPNTDFVLLSRQQASASDVPVVFGGDWGDTARLSEADTKGKIVVFTAHGGWTGFLRSARRGVAMPGVVAVAVAALDSVPAPVRGFFTRPQMFLDEGTPAEQSAPAAFFVTESAAAKLLGADPSGLTVGSTHGTASLDVRMTTKPSAFPARNVVGIIPGSDPQLRGEYVAIGAHNDHIGMTRPVDHDSIRIWNHIVRPEGADDGGKEATPAEQSEVDQELATYRAAHPNSQRIDSIDNGADDDGSGTVSALEIAQYFSSMKTKPKRSILFVWHV